MKWKDTGESKSENSEDSNPYYEDDGYTSFKETNAKKNSMFSGISMRYLFWGLGLAVVIFLILEMGSIINAPVDQARIDGLEKKIEQLEQKLEKVDGVDEKVTRIWEQAKSFETFKTRFDRSEASMSLRMDHLAMSLDALQKKTNETMQQLGKLEKAPVREQGLPVKTPVKARATNKTHKVVAGDTLYSIGRKYNLTLDELRTINKLPKEAVIHVGQVLVVNAVGN